MAGPALVERLAIPRPGIAVVFMSGYVDAITAHLGSFADKVAVIHKPFSPAEMARKVCKVLDAAAPQHSAQTIR
jgi:DNA-binding NtrC family response regulator